jgi:peptidoglycan/xylan/chitin deacetylase (PgdA/CDA1 family)
VPVVAIALRPPAAGRHMIAVCVIVLTFGVTLNWLFMSNDSQVFGYFPHRVRTSERHIALTFDDGPNEPYTSELLDLLKREQVKATFFVVGTSAEANPGVVRRIVSDGHVLGNHSYNHRFREYLLHLTFMEQIDGCQTTIQQLVGKSPTLYRSPWLFRQPWLLRTVRRLGMVPVSGVFGCSREILQPRARSIAKAALKKVKPGVILILHDGYNGRGAPRAHTVEAVEILIDDLRRRGYEFVSVDELLGVAPYRAEGTTPLPA